jgi:small subunit ribosomal protein S6
VGLVEVNGTEGKETPLMRAYEMMIIFEDVTDEADVNRILDQTVKLINAGNGRVAKTDRWGRRRFAYEINHKWEGIYVVLEVATEASNLDDVERMLRIADEVVRHKLIRLPDREAERRGLLGSAPAPVS